LPRPPLSIKLLYYNELYNLARKWDLYDGKNPIDSVSMPKVDNQQTKFLTDEELSRLLDTLETWPSKDTVAFIKFALLTGLRRGELFKLTWDDVDFGHGIVTLRDPKSGKTESIPVSMEALEVVKALEITSPFVFPGKAGRQRVDFNGPWRRIRKAVGLPDGFRFHGLRHHFASSLVSNGVDLLLVQKLLTHKDAKTTARNAHLAPGTIRRCGLKERGYVDPEP
jgi:integrase